MDVLHRRVSLYCLFHPSPLHSFTWLPLLCPLIWLSSLCQSVPFLSCNLSLFLIPFRWLFYFFVLSLLSSPQLISGLLPASLPLRFLLSELNLARLSQVWVSYFDFPSDLGVWWTFLSLRILKELDCLLLWKGPSVEELLAMLKHSPQRAPFYQCWCPFSTHRSNIITIM